MTSNIGFNKESVGFIEESNKNDTKLKEFLSLELLNRINKVIYFKKLDKDSIDKIVRNKLVDVKNKFKSKNIKIHIKDNLIDDITELTRYMEFGARKIDQVIEDRINNYVIDNILEGKTDIHVKLNN